MAKKYVCKGIKISDPTIMVQSVIHADNFFHAVKIADKKIWKGIRIISLQEALEPGDKFRIGDVDIQNNFSLPKTQELLNGGNFNV